MNKADNAVMYIKTSVVKKTEIVVVDRLRSLSFKYKNKFRYTIQVPAQYRPHDLQTSKFIYPLKKYIQECLTLTIIK